MNTPKFNSLKLFDDKFINKENLSQKQEKKFNQDELCEKYNFVYLFLGTYKFNFKYYMKLDNENLIFTLSKYDVLSLKHQYIEKVIFYQDNKENFYIQLKVGLSTHCKINKILSEISDHKNLGKFRNSSNNLHENIIIARINLNEPNVLKEKLNFFFKNNLEKNSNIISVFEKQAKYVLDGPIKYRKIKNSNKSITEIDSSVEIIQKPKSKDNSIIVLEEINDELSDNEIDFDEIINKEIQYWFNEGETITINKNDVYCLKNETYLNDKIIEFYLLFIKYNLIPVDIKKKTYIFNTFFFSKLLSSLSRVNNGRISHQEIYNSVKKWTKNVDIFDYDFLVIPIFKNYHWSLILVCYPNKILNSEFEIILDEQEFQKSCLIFMDSMNNKENCYNYFKLISIFLEQECYEKKKILKHLNEKTLITLIPRVPCQLNGYDCGIFVLHYVELFLKNPFIIFGNENLKQVSLEFWFKSSSLNNKRKEIFRILQKIFSENNLQNDTKINSNKDSEMISDDEIEIISDNDEIFFTIDN